MSLPIQCLALLAILVGGSAQYPTERPSTQDAKEAGILELLAAVDAIGASRVIIPEQFQPDRLEPLPWHLSFCPVHFEPLLPGEVAIVYGFLDLPPRAYIQARETLFPRSHNSTSGGCVVNPSRSTRPIHYCPSCRIAEMTWTKNQPR